MFGNNRDKRLRRRQEAEDFRRFFQPVAFLFGVVGLLILFWLGLNQLEGRPWQKELAGAALTLISFPILVLLYRLVRGHFRKDLHR